MAVQESKRLSKEDRRQQRRRAAMRRRRLARLRRAGVVAALLAVPGLWALERSGPQEMVQAEVVETRLQRHFVADGSSHTHTGATLKIEGLSETTLERADGYERGQRVPVWIRRGLITRWPYFLDVAKPGEIERRSREQETTGVE